jgi:hypothetical protein
MSIVVAHSPDLAVTSEIAYQSGKGQYNQWLAQFKQQQENQKTQALLGGFGAGSRLGLGIAGMQQKERMQTERLAQGTAKAAQQMESDTKWSQVHGLDLFDAAADRWPEQPELWKAVQNWSVADQKKLLEWSNGVRSQVATDRLKKGPNAISSQAGSFWEDEQALRAGNDAGSKSRQKIDHLYRTKQIDKPTYEQFNRRVDRNLRQFGNQPVRPRTSQENLDGDWVERALPGGGTVSGTYNPRTKVFTPHHETLGPAELKLQQFKTLKDGTTSLAQMDSTINGLMESLKGYEVAGQDERTMPSEEEEVEINKQLKFWRTAQKVMRERMMATEMGGDVSNLPMMTQQFIYALNRNQMFASDAQRKWAIERQKLHPDKYILDEPYMQHLRMGDWDTGNSIQMAGGKLVGEGMEYWRGEGALKSVEKTIELPESMRTAPERPEAGQGAGGRMMRYDETEVTEEPRLGAEDPSAPPMPRDIAPEPPSYELHEPGVPPAPDPSQPPPSSQPALPQGGPTTQADVNRLVDIANRLKAEGGRPKTAAQRMAEGLDIPPRLQKQGPEAVAAWRDKSKLYESSQGARRVAIEQAHKEHIVIGKTTRVAGRPDRPGGLRTVKGADKGGKGATAEVQATMPRPQKMSSAAVKFEIELDRLYDRFPRVEDRTAIRYVQSLLRKYNHDHTFLAANASPEEKAAWHDAQIRVQQLTNASGTRK